MRFAPTLAALALLATPALAQQSLHALRLPELSKPTNAAHTSNRHLNPSSTLPLKPHLTSNRSDAVRVQIQTMGRTIRPDSASWNWRSE